MKNKFRKILLEIIRILLAAIFIFASLTKISNPYEFAISIYSYQIVPKVFINFLALFIPWLELFVGFGLLFNYKLKANLIIYFSLMFVFTLGVFIALLKGLNIDCGCFGEGSEKVGLKKIGENVLIMIGAIILYFNSEET